MRFKLSEKPAFGRVRIKTCFLYFPKKIKNEWRWLEKAKINQVYLSGFGWTNTKWAQ